MVPIATHNAILESEGVPNNHMQAATYPRILNLLPYKCLGPCLTSNYYIYLICMFANINENIRNVEN